MDDYKDVIVAAIESGFTPDTCGSEEREYSWGVNSDFCGGFEDFKEAMRLGELSPGEVCEFDELIYKWGKLTNLNGMCPEEALAAQIGDGGSSKKTNLITFLMEDNGQGVYVLTLNATYEPTVDVAISFQMDGTEQNVTLPAGQKTLVTDLRGTDINKPYASISLITISAVDETYTYTSKNSVKSGKFTLTIINNGVKTTRSVKCGETVVLDMPSPKEGYTFIWRDINGMPIENNTFVMPESATKVTGTYEINTYVLHFIVTEQYFDNGELKTRIYNESDVNVVYKQKVNQFLPSAQRTGYSSLQWSYDSTIITTATTMPAQNITAESVYSLLTYSLTFKVDNVVYDSANLRYTESVVYPVDPAKTGYDFLQWDKTIQTMPAANTVINAVFSAINYTIEYFINGDKIDAYTETHIYGDAISIRPAEVREAYQFSGWNPSSLPSTMPAENISVYSTLVAIDYVLLIVSDGATLYRGTYNFGDEITVSIEDPEKEGYDFTGWEPLIPAIMPSHDVECVAQFKVKQITVTYRLDNGEIYSAVTYNYGDAISAITEPQKEGYTFTGWDEEIPATAGTVDIDVTATFTINIYTITYIVDGVSSVASYEYNAVVTPHEQPTKQGYTFTGWDSTEPATMPAQNITLTAQFTVNVHTIAWYVDNVLTYTDTYNYGDTVTGRPNETREGYTFSGWDTQVPAIMDDNDYVVRGTFTINQYTITFVLNGEPYTSITADYGTAIVAPTPYEEGYTFNGWSTPVPSTMPSQDMTINGTSTINSYIATYYIDGNVYTSMTYNYGTTIVYPVLPDVSGMTLVWNKVYVTMPASDISIQGTYQEAQQTIRIYYGTVPESAVSSFNSFNLLTPEDCTFEQGTELPFVVPGSPDYEQAASELDEDEWRQWLADHMYDYYVAVPYDAAITAVTFINSAGLDVTDLMTVLDHRVNYNGIDYVVYYRQCHSQGPTDSSPITETVTVFKDNTPVARYTATYYIDNILYTSMTYSVGAVIEYPDVPRQGYVLRWTKIYEVMPNTDIIINGVYKEESSIVTVYYGSVIVGDVPSFNNYSALTPLDCTIGTETPIVITIPLSPEYEEVEEEYSYEEFQRWVAEHMYHYYLLVPNDVTLTYTFKNAAGTIINETVVLVDNTTVNMSGVDCKKLHKECVSQTDVDQTGTITITIAKS